ncbi:MAG: hypothetical protein JNG88_17870 [Phycisphaerales bacterium]|nr:hypothetical protein [Phycisphaerales bacterium]
MAEFDTSDSRSAKKLRKKNLFISASLRGLPELDQFQNDEQRQEALHEIGEEASPARGGSGYWIGVGVLAGVGIGLQFGLRPIFAQLSWPPLVEDLIRWGFMLVVLLVVLRWLLCSGADKQLRVELLERGIPVCMECGYSLKRLPLEIGKCPECGRDFDDRVRAMLQPAPREETGGT